MAGVLLLFAIGAGWLCAELARAIAQFLGGKIAGFKFMGAWIGPVRLIAFPAGTSLEIHSSDWHRPSIVTAPSQLPTRGQLLIEYLVATLVPALLGGLLWWLSVLWTEQQSWSRFVTVVVSGTWTVVAVARLFGMGGQSLPQFLRLLREAEAVRRTAHFRYATYLLLADRPDEALKLGEVYADEASPPPFRAYHQLCLADEAMDRLEWDIALEHAQRGRQLVTDPALGIYHSIRVREAMATLMVSTDLQSAQRLLKHVNPAKACDICYPGAMALAHSLEGKRTETLEALALSERNLSRRERVLGERAARQHWAVLDDIRRRASARFEGDAN